MAGIQVPQVQLNEQFLKFQMNNRTPLSEESITEMENELDEIRYTCRSW